MRQMQLQMVRLVLVLVLITVIILVSCSPPQPFVAEDCIAIDEYTIQGPLDFAKGYPALNPDGSVNAVVEIPAGTTAKWEVNGTLPNGAIQRDGKLRWEFINGKPRTVRYLSFPGNYGLIPRTLSGDGDQLDILLLGPALPRGAVIKARCIAVLRVLDGGEVDDKIIGVVDGTPFERVKDLEGLDEGFPGAAEILRTWFLHYKGPGEIVFNGWGDREEAQLIINTAQTAFQKQENP